MKENLHLKVYRSTTEFNADDWDGLNTENDVFHTHLFLSDLEKAKVENSHNWYLMIYKDGILQCTAVLSSFIINLDIFLQFDSLVNTVRKLWPGFLKVRVLMCGIPASLGQKNIVMRHNADSAIILKLIGDYMVQISKKEKIHYQAFKEFRETELCYFDALLSQGFFRAFSLPYMKLNIRWKNFDQYLSDLRHGYKRQLIASLQKLGDHRDFIVQERTASTQTALFISDTSFCTPELFHAGYLEVMKRSVSKLETFNLDFFKNFFQSQRSNLVLLVVADTQKIHGAAVLVPHGKELTFALVSKGPEKDEKDTYFNLISGIVKYAIDHKYEWLNMGQTSYYAKARMGAVPENLYLYFKSSRPLMHALLKLFRKVFFPETKNKTLHVFKSKQ